MDIQSDQRAIKHPSICPSISHCFEGEEEVHCPNQRTTAALELSSTKTRSEGWTKAYWLIGTSGFHCHDQFKSHGHDPSTFFTKRSICSQPSRTFGIFSTSSPTFLSESTASAPAAATTAAQQQQPSSHEQ